VIGFADINIVLAAAIQDHYDGQKELRDRAAEPPGPHQIWMGPEPDGLGLSWLITHVHTDDPELFFMVPVTTVDVGLGSYDVEMPGWGVAYVGRGIWLLADVLRAKMERVAFWDATEARRRLSDIVLEKPPTNEPRLDDLYWEHLDELERIGESISDSYR